VTETSFLTRFPVEAVFLKATNSDPPQPWIERARARLAAGRNDQPSSKAGAVRALWPEIQQALARGHSLKTIRDWLEEEGVSLRYNQLATYVGRIRRRQPSRSLEVPPELDHRSFLRPEDKAAKTILPEPPQAVRDPLANLRARQGQSRTFEYNPEFKEEVLL